VKLYRVLYIIFISLFQVCIWIMITAQILISSKDQHMGMYMKITPQLIF